MYINVFKVLKGKIIFTYNKIVMLFKKKKFK